MHVTSCILASDQDAKKFSRLLKSLIQSSLSRREFEDKLYYSTEYNGYTNIKMRF